MTTKTSRNFGLPCRQKPTAKRQAARPDCATPRLRDAPFPGKHARSSIRYPGAMHTGRRQGREAYRTSRLMRERRFDRTLCYIDDSDAKCSDYWFRLRWKYGGHLHRARQS